MIKLPEDIDVSNRKPRGREKLYLVIITIVTTLLTSFVIAGNYLYQKIDYNERKEICPIIDKIAPKESDGLRSTDFIFDESYKKKSLEAWTKAIQIPSISYDDMGEVGEDSRWDVFKRFDLYFNSTFPKVSSRFDLIHVNTYGLVYILNGTDPAKKPLLLTAHTDVVPVPENTIPRWTYPPFEGHFDGEYVWGRGAEDCKNSLVAIFESLELLLGQGFTPKRTIVLGIGFDEEISGHHGAYHIGQYLLNRFGPDSIYLLLDEGGNISEDVYGSSFALPATGEKGYVDVFIKLATTGGHSSIPPSHTSIGIMAKIIDAIEDEPYKPQLIEENPYYKMLQCAAEHSENMDPKLRKNIRSMHLESSKKKVIKAIAENISSKYFISTSQAVDIIHGGLKINALPEEVVTEVNHRIIYGSSIGQIQEKVLRAVRPVAKRFGLSIDAFGVRMEFDDSTPLGKVTLTTYDGLQTAPVTPTENNPTWKLLSGTIRHVFEDSKSAFNVNQKPIFVAPSIMSGNTDTRHYWNLTKNIYRFNPIREDYSYNIHAIDERVHLDAHLETVAFFYDFVRNADQIR